MSNLFVPNSGGRFNVALNGNKLEITHTLGIMNDVVRPVDVADVGPWKAAFSHLISAHWEGRYNFTRGTQVVAPKFSQTFVDYDPSQPATGVGCHYICNLIDSRGGSESVSSKPAKGFATTDVNFPRASSLFAGSVQPTGVNTSVAASLKDLFPMYVDVFHGQPTPASMAHLVRTASSVSRAQPGQRLYVTGYGTESSNAKTAVLAALRAAGLHNVSSRMSKKSLKFWKKTGPSQSKASQSTDYIKISTKEEVDATLIQQSAVYQYPAAVVHEFGHMLGLKDEYACLSQQAAQRMADLNFIDASEQQRLEDDHVSGARVETDDVKTQQEEFIKYCEEAGVQPSRFGHFTSSIMANGSDFYPCHFVTLWAALVSESTHNDWQIIKA